MSLLLNRPITSALAVMFMAAGERRRQPHPALQASRAPRPRRRRRPATSRRVETSIVGLPGDIVSTDPALNSDGNAYYVAGQAVEGLVGLKPASLSEIVPALATALPHVSSDGLTYTFKLRTGVKLHDGTNFNADAGKYTYTGSRTYRRSCRTATTTTTATSWRRLLDVTIQAQVLELLRELIAREQTSLALITHDLGVEAGMTDRVNVMYAGEVIETGRPWTSLRARPIPTWSGYSMPRTDAAVPLIPIEGEPTGPPRRAGRLPVRASLRMATRRVLARTPTA